MDYQELNHLNFLIELVANKVDYISQNILTEEVFGLAEAK